jgi:hypothetical protein
MALTISIKDKETFHRLWTEGLKKSKNNDSDEFHKLLDDYRGYFGKDFNDMIKIMMDYPISDEFKVCFDNYLNDIEWFAIKDREPPRSTVVYIQCAKGKKHRGLHNSNSTTTKRGIFDCGAYDVWDGEYWAFEKKLN